MMCDDRSETVQVETKLLLIRGLRRSYRDGRSVCVEAMNVLRLKSLMRWT